MVFAFLKSIFGWRKELVKEIEKIKERLKNLESKNDGDEEKGKQKHVNWDISQ